MSKCKTCNEIAEWQRIIDTQPHSEWSDKAMCKVVIVGWLKNEPKKTLANKHNVVNGNIYTLAYCPTCGTKLSKRFLKKLLKEVE